MVVREALAAAVAAGLVSTGALSASSSWVAAAEPAILCEGVPATVVGSPEAETVVGTEAADVIVSLREDVRIEGLGGNDRICGESGIDVLVGGAGDDLLFGGSGGYSDYVEGWPRGDTLIGGPGDDLLVPGADEIDLTDADPYEPDMVSFEDAPNGVTVNLAKRAAVGHGNDTIVLPRGRAGTVSRVGVIGSPFDDLLIGSDRSDRFITLTGRDRVYGGMGGDQMWLVPGFEEVPREDEGDLFVGGPGKDYAILGAGDDTVRLGAGSDSVTDLGGRQDIRGGPGEDDLGPIRLDAGPRRHVVLGGPGIDSLYLGKPSGGASEGKIDLRRNVLRSSNAAGTTRGRLSAFEYLELPRGWWKVWGTGRAETLRILGRGSRLWWHGRGGDDVVSTRSGDDRLDGGPGYDRAYPSRGDDACVSIEEAYDGCR